VNTNTLFSGVFLYKFEVLNERAMRRMFWRALGFVGREGVKDSKMR
jgi:hypothetical protein